MPWLDQTQAVVEAWYPGTSGGEAIARLLFGEVAPSGRLPVSFPRDESQLPRPRLDGLDLPDRQAFDVDYKEGAAVGYKWYDRQGLTPLFPFGYGLTYGDFSYAGLKAAVTKNRITASFDVRNTGRRTAKAVPQIYVGPKAGGWEAPRRLAGWRKIELKPGQTRHMVVTIEPRLLATFDPAKGWSIAAGDYEVSLAASSRDLRVTVPVALAAQALPIRLPARTAP